MGRLTVVGPRSLDWLESLLTRRVAGIDVGRVRYTLVTGEAGRGVCILDDALVSRDTDAADGTPRMGLVVNASNRERVVDWLGRQLPEAGVTFVDRTAETAMIAVQGPLALDIVCGLCLPEDAARIGRLGNYRATTASVAGHPAAVSRTGYTGEDGLEIVVPAAAATAVWESIHDAGAPRGLRACGLGARDTLRLEAGMPLYGHELREDSDPFAIGLGLAIDLDGRRFPGSEAFASMRGAPGGHRHQRKFRPDAGPGGRDGDGGSRRVGGGHSARRRRARLATAGPRDPPALPPAGKRSMTGDATGTCGRRTVKTSVFRNGATSWQRN
jgi:aminomethyltransferase